MIKQVVRGRGRKSRVVPVNSNLFILTGNPVNMVLGTAFPPAVPIRLVPVPSRMELLAMSPDGEVVRYFDTLVLDLISKGVQAEIGKTFGFPTIRISIPPVTHA